MMSMSRTGFAVVALCAALAACNKSEAEPQAGAGAGAAGAKGAKGGKGAGSAGRGVRPFPVEVEKVATRQVEYTLAAVGTVEAFEEVQVTARVAGVVEAVRFVEGAQVKQGQTLVEIEPARFQLAVRAAKADLEKAEAAAADADAGLARRDTASKENPGLIPGEEIETYRTKVRTAKADVSAAKVALDTAELNLRDAYVKAPMAGLLQTRTVKTGQYVQVGTVLGTLSRRDPLLLKFTVADRDAGKVTAGMKVTFVTGGAGQVGEPYSAKVTLVGAAADPTTRMVAVTAEIDDPRKTTLQPGAFARVTVGVGGSADAAVIPQLAVRPSERGFLAYVVEGGQAHERVLQLGMRTADDLVEVKDGVKPGEDLVVRGAEALREGAQVTIVPRGSSKDTAVGSDAIPNPDAPKEGEAAKPKREPAAPAPPTGARP
jgi:multidrug efflux system membrane fusion protein